MVRLFSKTVQPGLMDTDSLASNERVPPTKRRLRFGLSTLIGMVVAIAILLAIFRPRPEPEYEGVISIHDIKFSEDEEPSRQRQAMDIRSLIEAKRIVGMRAGECFLPDQGSITVQSASSIVISTDQIRYSFQLKSEGNKDEWAIVVVDPRTAIVTKGYLLSR
jgi:hypothetical protein